MAAVVLEVSVVPTEVEAVSTRGAPGGPGLVMANFVGKGRRTCSSPGADTISEAGGPPGASRKPNSEGKVAKHNSVSNSSFPQNLSRGRGGGGLKLFLSIRECISQYPWVLESVQGIKLEFLSNVSSKPIKVLQGNCRSHSHGNPGSETNKCSSNVKHCFSRFRKHTLSCSNEKNGARVLS